MTRLLKQKLEHKLYGNNTQYTAVKNKLNFLYQDNLKADLLPYKIVKKYTKQSNDSTDTNNPDKPQYNRQYKTEYLKNDDSKTNQNNKN